MPSLLVIIPAYNEEDCIGAVVHDAQEVLDADVAVIDDGSTDATATRARAAGARVLSLPYNLGVGGAIRTGLRYAQDRGYSRVVQLDGDGQHEAAEAKRLLDELDDSGADFVVGARFANGYEVGRSRRLAMRALSGIVSRRLRTRITDTTSGFRAMGPRAIDLFARHYPVDYLSDTVEALLLAGEADLRVGEVDVRMRLRQGGRASTSSLRSLYHLGRLLFVIVVREIVRRPAGRGEEER
ncbi:MAG TPA: glycosyltransferase family 2 protein [Acidimicrobiia bacterium]